MAQPIHRRLPTQSPPSLLRLANLADLDLPQLYQQPSYEALETALSLLEYKPRSWDRHSAMTTEPLANTELISQYLTSIIKSDLGWLSNAMCDDVASTRRESLWELAGKRLSERCGRSAMPQMIRTWVIPISGSNRDLRVELCEPPLTADNLGLKTWGTAFSMSKKLGNLTEQYFQQALSSVSGKPRVLELGAGTGLLGIAAAMMWDASFTLTDLPDILPNLSSNVSRNEDQLFGSVEVKTLDWADINTSEIESVESRGVFDVILVSDPLYDDSHPDLVTRAIAIYLNPTRKSRVLAAIPIRDEATKRLKSSFVGHLRRLGFDALIQGEEEFYDDWEGPSEDEAVNCWWSVWQPTESLVEE